MVIFGLLRRSLYILSGMAPESTAARVALWRALHAQIDAPPPVLDDQVGLRLIAPPDDWRRRPDMDPGFTRRFRASIVARALPRRARVQAEPRSSVSSLQSRCWRWLANPVSVRPGTCPRLF
jgi:hypothetical protein